jgi:hypothetical protein
MDKIPATDGADPTTPGPEHKNLMAFVGTWELTVDGVPQKGSATIKSILGGRFITEDVKIPFGDFAMMPTIHRFQKSP